MLKRSYRCRTFFLLILITLTLLLAGCDVERLPQDEPPFAKATLTPSEIPPPSTATPTERPEPSVTEPPVCDEVVGKVVEGSYEGVVYEQDQSFLIYLPPCYRQDGPRYPVAYLLHGYPFDQSHWVELGLIARYEEGLASEKWPEIVFVLPYVPDSLFIHTDGGVGSYEQELLEGLVPAIEKDYLVETGPGSILLGGVSRGGVWALEIGLRNPDRINHLLAISPALVYNQPRPRYDPFEIIRESRDFPESIFISAAENETPFREEIEAFVEALTIQEISHEFLLHPGNHNDPTWTSIMDDILRVISENLSTEQVE